MLASVGGKINEAELNVVRASVGTVGAGGIIALTGGGADTTADGGAAAAGLAALGGALGGVGAQLEGLRIWRLLSSVEERQT